MRRGIFLPILNSSLDIVAKSLGMTVKEIAQAEDVDLSWVYKSIKRGLKCLGKNFKNFN